MRPPSLVLAAAVLGRTAIPLAAEVRPWKPAGISSPQFESHAAFDPRTGELYFVNIWPPACPDQRK